MGSRAGGVRIAAANFGLNPELSRLAIGQATNSVYLIPAHDHICVALTAGEGVGMTCPTTEQVATGQAGPVVGTVGGGAIAIFGVVPDGVDAITLETGVANSDVLEVANNAYYAVVEAGTVLRSVGYEGPSGGVEWPIHSPATVFDEE